MQSLLLRKGLGHSLSPFHRIPTASGFMSKIKKLPGEATGGKLA